MSKESALKTAASMGGRVLQAYRTAFNGEPGPEAMPFFLHAGTLRSLTDLKRAIDAMGPPGNPDPRLVAEFALALHREARWAASGYNVFDLTPSLAAGLLLTEPQALTVAPNTFEELRWPYQTFALRIPDGCVPIFHESADQLEWARVIWCHTYVTVYSEIDRRPSVMCSAVTEVDSTRPIQSWIRSPLLELTEDFSDIAGTTLTETDPPTLPEDSITSRAIWKLVRNFVDWLNAQMESDDGDKPQRTDKGRPSKAARAARGAWPVFWVAGRHVNLPAEVRDSVADLLLGRSSRAARAGWQLRTQHVVRGHWRQQVHGHGGTARRTIWIEPYMRGPEAVEARAPRRRLMKARRSIRRPQVLG